MYVGTFDGGAIQISKFAFILFILFSFFMLLRLDNFNQLSFKFIDYIFCQFKNHLALIVNFSFQLCYKLCKFYLNF